MSRVGKMPIKIPSSVKVSFSSNHIIVEGAKGKLELDLLKGVSVVSEGEFLLIKNDSQGRKSLAIHGLFRALIANMVLGVTDGFTKKLKIVGIGYRVQAQGNRLNFTIGKSHPVFFDVPQSLSLTVTDSTHFEITGIDKQRVGQIASDIRSIYPPEPYKGKGILYEGEKIRWKEGKSVG